MHEHIEKATKNLTLNELSRFAFLYNKSRSVKSTAIIFWALSGILGGHRFYLRDFKGGIIIALITIFTLGLGGIIGIMDIVSIPKKVDESNRNLVLKIVKEVRR